MLVVYHSKTGNVRRFMKKLDVRYVEISEMVEVKEPFVLVTYTTGFGQIPEKVQKFLRDNSAYLRGVSASGNKNWGDMFARSADLISNQYGVPVISKFELSGRQKDVLNFLEGMKTIDEAHSVEQ